MPYLVVCPSCSTKLKSAQPVPAGRTLTCPQCKGAFTLSEPAPEIDATSSSPKAAAPAAPPVQAAPPPAPVPAPPPKPARSVASALEEMSPRRGRRVEDEDIASAEIVDGADFDYAPEPKSKRRRDEDDDRPRSRRRDDDEYDDRPRSRRRDEDDDDRPRSRRSRDDDDDDRPRSRRNRDRDEDDDDRPRRGGGPASDFAFDDDTPKSRRDRADDEDDRPRARRGRDEDEDDDDRPRSYGRKKKKGNKGLLIGLIGGVAALLFLCGGGALMYFVDPFGLFGGASGEMLAWMPSDTRTIEYVDVKEVSNYEKPKQKMRTQFSYLEGMGIKFEDVDAVMAGGKSSGTPRETIVVKLSSSADRDKIVKAASGQEATAAGQKYYRTKDGMGLYFASDRLLVLTGTHTNMPKVLEKGEKIDLPPDLKDATGRARGHIWNAQANPQNTLGGGLKGPDPFGLGAPPTPRYQITSMTLSGGSADMRMEMEFNDSDSARRMADLLERFLSMVRGFAGMGGADAKSQAARKAFETAKVTTSGTTCILTMEAPIDGEEFRPFPF